jgi:RNA polymerase sigma factor (sigma-70 family)
MQPDAVLCKLCMRGSDDAFAVLHARYSQQVFAFVFHLLNRPGSVDDAEDLTQEILGKAFSNMSTRRDEGSFKAWLFRIARNHTFDHIRARRSSPASFDDPDFHEEPSNVISLQQQVEKRSEMDWLLAAMGRLPERQREALVMRELGGMSYDEIGETLATSPEGVKQLIKRGRSTVSQAAEVSGYRSKSLKRDLGLATPIVTIGWLGSGAGTAAAATGGFAAAGSAVAGGTGLALLGGKTAATVLAVVAVGTGGVVVGEQVVSERSATDVPTQSDSGTSSGTPTVPAQSLTVGEKAAAVAKANKLAANKRRELAQERKANAKAKAKRAAAVKRSAAAKSKAKSNSAGGRSNGSSKSTGSGNSSSGGGSSNSSSGGSKSATENTIGGNGAGSQGGSQTTTQGSGNGSANSNAGGKSKE